ncbi:DNA-3-methyladenine glycosylase I [Vibrio scophthalmi]|uniref:DNA-3-methyladenine glycosylase I n=1 Tax=Vibrio scophthalmi TaxID=45658 RepID=UPI003EBCBCED
MEQETCAWARKHPLEQAYHDAEWGVPVYDDNTLFEFITLEGAQAGLSWITILKKREGYRQAFEEYDLSKLSRYSAEQVEARTEEIITRFDVVKHRGKIRSVFSNAQAALRLVEEYGSLSNALWQFVEHKPIINHWQTMSEVPTSSAESKAMSQFLKKRGFKFVGETICYAFLQATGMVDDHLQTCPKKAHL